MGHRRYIVWVATLMCLACVQCEAAGKVQLYMVWSQEAPLFRGKDLAGHLNRGEVVQAKPAPGDGTWLLVARKDGVFSSAREHYRSEREVLERSEVRIRDGEKRLEALERRLEQNTQALRDYYAFQLQVYRDGVVYFEIPVRSSAASAGGDGVDGVQAGGKRVPKLTSSQRSKYLRLAGREIKDRRDREAGLREERLEVDGKTKEALLWQDYIKERFGKCQRNTAGYAWQGYIVVAKTAALYMGNELAGELKQGTVVLARVHEQQRDWLVVRHGEQDCGSSADDYSTTLEWQRKRESVRTQIRHKIDAYQSDVELLELREDLYGTHIDELDHDVKRGGEFIPYAGGGRSSSGVDAYRIDLPVGATQVLDRSGARQLVRKWKKQRAEWREEAEKKRQAIERLERELARDELLQSQMESRVDALEAAVTE